jgi:ferritin-like metal-binding protein YciE
MRDLTPVEMSSLRESFLMETTGLISLKQMQPLISDEKLKVACDAGIQAGEGRIRALQQFIQENGIMSLEEVQ